jgi:hypothetical protein
MDYVNLHLRSRFKNKAKTNPKQTQFKANQTQYKPNTNPIKPNTNPILSAILSGVALAKTEALAKAEQTQYKPR